MVDLGVLRWSVEANTDDLDRAQESMDRTGQAADRTQNSARRLGSETTRTGRTTRTATRDMEQGWNRVSGAAQAVRLAVAAIAGAAVVRSLNNAVQASVQLGNTLDKTARSAGITAERVQELRFAFGQLAEVSDQQVDLALQQFNIRFGRAQEGVTAMREQFDALGVSMRNTTQGALTDALRGLASIESDARRASAASELFGFRAGPQLAAALSQGADAVDDLAAKLRADGGVISDEAIRKSAELADMMDRLNRQLTAERTEAILANAEAIESLAEAMGRLQRLTIGALAGVTRFAQFVGEELAAQIHGVSADDIPRLTREINALEERLQERRRGPASAQADRRSEIEARLNILRAQLEAAQAMEVDAAVERIEAAAEAARTQSQQTDPIEIPTRLEVPRIDLLDWDDLRAEADRFFTGTRTEAERLQADIERVQRLAAMGLFPEGVDEDILRRLNERLDNLADDVETFGSQVVSAMADSTGGALEEMFARGEISAGNFMEAVLRDLAKVMTQLLIIQPLMRSMFGEDGSGGLVSSLLGGIGIPGFANGTKSAPGGLAVVGERGPELVNLPRGSGVTPNHQLSGLGGGTKVEVIDQRGAGAPPVDVQRTQAQGREQIRVLIRGEVDSMFADGSIDKRFRAAGMPVARRGAR